MHHDRRTMLRLATAGSTAAALWAFGPGAARAQPAAAALPDAARILVGFPPGGGIDQIARRLADSLSGILAGKVPLLLADGHALTENVALIEGRDWLLGDWSVADAYAFWVCGRIQGGPLDLARHVRLADHVLCMKGRGSVQRALARELAAVSPPSGASLPAPPQPIPQKYPST